MRSQLYQDLPYLLARAADLTVTALAPEGGLDRLQLRAPGLAAPMTLFVDPATGRPARLAMTVVGMQGPQEVVVTYGDYREVDGLLLPFATSQTVGGEAGGRSSYRVIAINPEVDEGLFALE